MKNKDEQVPRVLLVIAGIIILVSVFMGGITYLIGGLVALFCAKQCYKWGRKIGDKGYVAFFIGLLVSLLGLLLYYLWYRISIKGIVIKKK